MWLTAILVVLSSSICHAKFEWEITDYETEQDLEYTDRRADWTREFSGYWMKGLWAGYYSDYNDRKYKWRYGRPYDANTDYSYNTLTSTLDITPIHDEWERLCPSNYAIYSIDSYFYDDPGIGGNLINNDDDRQFTIQCKELPEQFTFGSGSCQWTDYLNTYKQTLDRDCDGMIRGIQSTYSSSNDDRLFKFACCDVIINDPINLIKTQESTRVVVRIESKYNSGIRTTKVTGYGQPRWYNGNITDYIYDLTNSRSDIYVWERLCPMNGAFSTITQNDDGTFSFECAKLVDEVVMTNCLWNEYLNEFHGTFKGDAGLCPKDGAIRGIQSYYSPASNDVRFKTYCCAFERGIFIKNTDITINVKTHSESGSESVNVITFNLCWNNDLYQGIKTLHEINTEFIVDDMLRYDSCGNKRTITLAMDGTDDVRIESIGVQEDDIDYTIEIFRIHIDTETEETITAPDFSLYKSNDISVMDVIVEFPDNFLTACEGTDGCTGDLYNLDDYQEYLITISPCATFTEQEENQQIGVIIRGLNGNLDKAILTAPFNEVLVGKGNVGQLVHVSMEYESGSDFCVESVAIYDPYEGVYEFETDYFGDGMILSGDCGINVDFHNITDTQYVPCYDTPFSILTYESSLYSSTQIHSCDGSESGISSANSGTLSLTITGMSKNDKFVSSGALSLKSLSDWNPGESRDYTLQLSGEFEEISFITLSNNDADALCVDSVLINGEEAFLVDYWVGFTTDHDSLQTIPAVLEWPICDVELTTTIHAETPLDPDPDNVATATCVNRNRLIYVDCVISQTYETYQEVVWSQQVGQEIAHETAIQNGQSVSVSQANSFGTKTELKTSYKTFGVAQEFTAGFSYEGSWGKDEETSESTSTTEGTTTMNLTTDGTVNGESLSIECSGSVSVPPSQQIGYSIMMGRTEVELTTLTDMKMTKCSALLYGDLDDEERLVLDPDPYIYVYGIEGKLNVAEATSCYIEFGQSLQVSPEEITCGKERALATREWGTFVPQCDPEDPDKYMNCQCAFGDTRTLPTCGCVDPTTGNLLETEDAAVVAENDTYKWADWCADHCRESANYDDLYSNNVLRSAQPLKGGRTGRTVVNDQNIHVVNDPILESNNDLVFIGYGLLMIGSLIGIIYAINSCSVFYDKYVSNAYTNKYHQAFESETEVEKV